MIDAQRDAAPQLLPALPGPVTARSRAALMRDAETVVLAAYEAHARDLNGFARSLVRDREDAEDVVAEAFLRLVREVHAGRTPDDVRGWLYRVTANLVLSRGRRLATARRFVSRIVDRRTAESPEARHLRLDLSDDLREALLALPADARVAVVMAARGASGREIATALGRSEAATRTLLTRSRQRVRAHLGDGRPSCACWRWGTASRGVGSTRRARTWASPRRARGLPIRGTSPGPRRDRRASWCSSSRTRRGRSCPPAP